MGNCIEVCSATVREEEREKEMLKEGEELMKNQSRSSSGNGIRVKMVVTKEELQWLMQEFNTKSSLEASGKKKNNNSKRVEKLFGELEKRRKRSAQAQAQPPAWKPSLDSITEDP